MSASSPPSGASAVVAATAAAADSDTDAGSSVTSRAHLYRGKAPIASMDAMEDMDLFLSGSNSHLCKVGSSQECNVVAAGGDAGAAGASAAPVNGSGGAAMPPPPAYPLAVTNGHGPAGVSVGTAAGAAGIGAGAGPGSKATAAGIKYRHVGKTGLRISNLGLGSMKLFSHDNPSYAEEIVSVAFEHGINFFDISDPQQQDKAETEFGKIFKKKGWNRRQFNVCTKINWSSRKEDRCLSRKEIIESIKQSLRNLQLEYVDLILIHKNDPNCPTEEVVRAMDYCVNQGLAMYWGTSRWTLVEIYDAFSVAKQFNLIGPICEMAEYHWFHREKVELYMAELYNRIGFGLITWSPISYGLGMNAKDVEANQLLTKLYHKSMKHKSLEPHPPSDCLMPGPGPGPIPGPGATDMTAICPSGSASGPTAAVTPAAVTAVAQGDLRRSGIVTSSGGGIGGVGGTSSSSVTATATATATGDAVVVTEPQNRLKQLGALAERAGCTVNQLLIAWCVRNQTSQAVVTSAATPEQFREILNSLQFVAKVTIDVSKEIDKILDNKPLRPPMISTLQQRWASTGGVMQPQI